MTGSHFTNMILLNIIEYECSLGTYDIRSDHNYTVQCRLLGV